MAALNIRTINSLIKSFSDNQILKVNKRDFDRLLVTSGVQCQMFTHTFLNKKKNL